MRLPIEDRTLTSRTILLVEDDAQDEELTLRALRQSNILNKVVVARDGEMALNYFQGRAEFAGRNLELLPAVVLLDLKLPKLSGLEVLRWLRAEPCTNHLPVVILTSSQEQSDIAEAYALGANSFICKPVDFDKFTQAVGQLGLYWVLLNEPPPQRPGAGSADSNWLFNAHRPKAGLLI